MIDVSGFAVEDAAGHGAELRLSGIFRDLPVAMLKARSEAVVRRLRKRASG
jgi:hypothetical protein